MRGPGCDRGRPAGASLYFQAATLDLSGLSDTVRTSNGVEAVTGN